MCVVSEILAVFVSQFQSIKTLQLSYCFLSFKVSFFFCHSPRRCCFIPTLSQRLKSNNKMHDSERQKDYTNETNLYGFLKNIIHIVECLLVLVRERQLKTELFVLDVSSGVYYLSGRKRI